MTTTSPTRPSAATAPPAPAHTSPAQEVTPLPSSEDEEPPVEQADTCGDPKDSKKKRKRTEPKRPFTYNDDLDKAVTDVLTEKLSQPVMHEILVMLNDRLPGKVFKTPWNTGAFECFKTRNAMWSPSKPRLLRHLLEPVVEAFVDGSGMDDYFFEGGRHQKVSSSQLISSVIQEADFKSDQSLVDSGEISGDVLAQDSGMSLKLVCSQQLVACFRYIVSCSQDRLKDSGVQDHDRLVVMHGDNDSIGGIRESRGKGIAVLSGNKQALEALKSTLNEMMSTLARKVDKEAAKRLKGELSPTSSPPRE